MRHKIGRKRYNRFAILGSESGADGDGIADGRVKYTDVIERQAGNATAVGSVSRVGCVNIDTKTKTIKPNGMVTIPGWLNGATALVASRW